MVPHGMEFESPAFRMIEIEIGIALEDTKVFHEYFDDLDIEYFRRKLHGALKVPTEFLT